MFAITGITGQVGGEVAHNLIVNNEEIRPVVRDLAKAKYWEQRGCNIFVADMNDSDALVEAFTGTAGVFILLPPTFDPSAGFIEAHRTIKSIHTALSIAKPPKIVCLSTIGANSKQFNLLNQLGILEKELSSLPMPVAFLRAAWFMENYAWDVASAIEDGVISSFLQPLDKPFPMVATADVGRVAAELLKDVWAGQRIINLEGTRISPNEIASSFSKILGKSVRTEAIPSDTWHSLFISHGMKNPEPRIQMLNGFNQGWIEFDDIGTESRKGEVSIDTVIKKLVRSYSQG
ncbi:MAG TPA: NmrA family NAD(P)-binding protein [Methylotenera sp.]|nr:NmrA family NAD(P)-binding protein [Methylotenera sp.]